MNARRESLKGLWDRGVRPDERRRRTDGTL